MPPSVNRTRRVDYSALRAVEAWRNNAHALVLAQRARRPKEAIKRYELHITFAEGRRDLDNGLKAVIDYLRGIEITADDGPKNLRKLTVEFGDAPHGCRVEVRPI